MDTLDILNEIKIYLNNFLQKSKNGIVEKPVLHYSANSAEIELAKQYKEKHNLDIVLVKSYNDCHYIYYVTIYNTNYIAVFNYSLNKVVHVYESIS